MNSQRQQEGKEGSAILERTNKTPTISLSDYLNEDLVIFLSTHDQQETLLTLIDLLDEKKELKDKEAFFRAILQREKIVSTGIGIGVAIPHAKLKGYEDFFICIGVHREDGIQWQALDGLPVKIVFMIGGPDDRQIEYLNILSMITTAIKDEERRKKLLQANNAKDVIAVFEDL